MSKSTFLDASDPGTTLSLSLHERSYEGVQHLFERQVALTAESVAVVYEDDSITFSQLNSLANALAAHLRSTGVQRGDAVAIVARRSKYTVIAMLAVLKSAAAYVPIDPSTPEKRAQYFVSDSKAACVLFDRESSHLVSRILPPYIPTVDLEDPTLYARDIATPSTPIAAADEAYCMYTSGSTGTPKGVVMHHRGLTNYVRWATKQYVTEDIRTFALFTSLAFDLSVTSVFVPLVSGRCLHIYPEPPDGISALENVVRENRVDILKLTPSHLAILRELDLRGSHLKVLILGGEDLRVDAAKAITKKLPKGTVLYNEYGPTETAVGCMIHRYDLESDRRGSVPLGVPIDRMRIHLLDERLLPAEVGTIGQIYIGGDGVAAGYRNNPEATARAFIKDPFIANSTLYASGDLARVDEDGHLRFIGRQDSQVKVRGHRIELPEVEKALYSHPKVIECVVVAKEIGGRVASTGLVGYCAKCGIPSNVPNTVLGETGICNHCVAVEQHRDVIDAYFETMDDLALLCEGIKREAQPEYDCIVALSGGKDSTYMLCRVLELGMRIFAFTLDNGYISDEAKANIARIVDKLKIDHRYVSTPHMRDIFADSLRRHSNVCNGCFKTIYTIAINLSQELGVRYIFVGLSKGQLFETRASEVLRMSSFDKAAFESNLLEARKIYHRVNDAVFKLLDTRNVMSETVIETVKFVDFYRYCHVTREEIYRYIEDRIGWNRPADTGRSTNCKMNEVGIYVHTKQRRYHNYALPYSWEVRFGHITRDDAMRELDDLREVDVGRVTEILSDIGFKSDMHRNEVRNDVEGRRLIAYYVALAEIPESELRSAVLRSLPDYMVPARFVHLERIPLTPNGKVNKGALPSPVRMGETHREEGQPMSPFENELLTLWKGVLKKQQIGMEDDFFEAGGASLTAVILLHRVGARYGKRISVQEFAQSPTVRGLAKRILEQANSYM